jgi:hypothetical protein
MTASQYRKAIARLGLSQVAAGRLLSGDPRTSRRWASGESPVPKSVGLLLRILIQFEIDPGAID